MSEINLVLHQKGVKDFSRESCEHCGLIYRRSTQLPGRDKPFFLKIQCDTCVEAERTIEKIHEVMRITNARLCTLRPDKDAEQIRAFHELTERQRAKLSIVLQNIRRFTKEQSCHSEQKPGTEETRMPYKE